MATQAYMTGRRKYSRPQAVLFSQNPGTLQLIDQGTENEKVLYYPDGYEVGQTLPAAGLASDADQFIILSDHNRAAIDFSTDRIENRERMINGRMRSYHVADKLNLSLSCTEVFFADLSDREIEIYVATKEPLQVAGGFTIDGLGGAFVESINGDYHTVVGLSLVGLRKMMVELGLDYQSLWR